MKDIPIPIRSYSAPTTTPTANARTDMSTQYRMLEPGEVIQEGDEWLDSGAWMPCVGTIGMLLPKHNYNFRHPIKATNESSISQSEITVEQAMKELLRASENQPESTIENGPSVIRKFLSIGAEFENWPECYQKLACEISRIQSDRESLKSELARLQSGGCARDQRTTQWCAEASDLRTKLEAEYEGNRTLAMTIGGMRDGEHFRSFVKRRFQEVEQDKARLIGALKAIVENSWRYDDLCISMSKGKYITSARILLAELEEGKKDE